MPKFYQIPKEVFVSIEHFYEKCKTTFHDIYGAMNVIRIDIEEKADHWLGTAWFADDHHTMPANPPVNGVPIPQPSPPAPEPAPAQALEPAPAQALEPAPAPPQPNPNEER